MKFHIVIHDEDGYVIESLQVDSEQNPKSIVAAVKEGLSHQPARGSRCRLVECDDCNKFVDASSIVEEGIYLCCKECAK